MEEDKKSKEEMFNSFDRKVCQESNYHDNIKLEKFEHNLEELHHSIDIKEEPDPVEEIEDEDINKQEIDYTSTSHGLLVKREFWMCTLCYYQTTKKSDSERHLKTHTKKYLFTCRSCNLRFSFKSKFQQHLRRHVGDKQFVTLGMQKMFEKRTTPVSF